MLLRLWQTPSVLAPAYKPFITSWLYQVEGLTGGQFEMSFFAQTILDPADRAGQGASSVLIFSATTHRTIQPKYFTHK